MIICYSHEVSPKRPNCVWRWCLGRWADVFVDLCTMATRSHGAGTLQRELAFGLTCLNNITTNPFLSYICVVDFYLICRAMNLAYSFDLGFNLKNKPAGLPIFLTKFTKPERLIMA